MHGYVCIALFAIENYVHVFVFQTCGFHVDCERIQFYSGWRSNRLFSVFSYRAHARVDRFLKLAGGK